MSLARLVLLKVSDNTWLREHGTKAPFVRRAVRRFMPGETFEEMAAAARALAGAGIDAVYTRLGENVRDRAEADEVADHYEAGIGRAVAAGLRAERAVERTKLGLDIDRELAVAHATRLARVAHDAGSYLWVDMEQSAYVDVTLDIVRRLREVTPAVGVCLQAYLRRTPGDLADMLERGIGVRLVKGAYNEPADVAWPAKADVDRQYFALASEMLSASAAGRGGRAVFGTHDVRLIARIREHAAASAGAAACEFHMLYGIQRAEQTRLVAEGATVRVLIAYGSYWFRGHAAAGRAAGERLVRAEEPRRLSGARRRPAGHRSAAPDLLDPAVAVVADALDVPAVVGLEFGAGGGIPRGGQSRLEEDILLRQTGLGGLSGLGDARLLLVGQRSLVRLAGLGVLLAQARHRDLQRALRGVIGVGHAVII